MPHLMTVPEAAERLNLSQPTVSKLIRNGQLEAFKLGYSVRISEESIIKMLAESKINRKENAK